MVTWQLNHIISMDLEIYAQIRYYKFNNKSSQ